jgi:tetratricopeptide (TPR) repeat protein
MGKPVCRENEREIKESRARCDSIEELAGSKWPAEPAEASMNETGRLFARVVLSAIGALATHGASAQTADDAVVCNGPHSTVAADDRIAACTRVIDSGQWRVEALGWAYLNRCLAQYDKRAWDEALSDCSKAIEIDPKVAQAFIKRGFVWQAKGENDKAIADYDEAIRLDPKDAVAFVNRGIAWGAKGDNDRAIDDYDQAMQLDPKDAGAFFDRGYVWQAKGEYDKAIADYNEAIRLDPKLVRAFVNRGSAWLIKGDNDKAIADYDEAIRLDPKDAPAFAGRSIAWLGKGDDDRAIADSEEAMRIDPKDAHAFATRGNASNAKGDSTARSPTSTRRSGSIPSGPALTSIAAPCLLQMALLPTRRLISPRRMRSTPNTPLQSCGSTSPSAATGCQAGLRTSGRSLT